MPTRNAVQEPLNYRGLRRWSMLILFPVLLLSAWVAAMLLTILAMPFLLGPFSAAAIAGVGMIGVAAMIVPPVIGTLAGLWGVATGKRKVVKFFRGKRLAPDHPLVRVTEDQATRLGMACPEVYVYEDDDINAWATGVSPSNAAVGITRGALQRLSPDHVHAVIGHELGHIAAADIRRMQFAISFQNALVWFFGLRSWRWRAQHLFGFVGQLGIMGMSRRREYWADAVGAVLTSADAMKGALLAVERDGQQPRKNRRYYNQLMFNWHGGSLLASHPTMSQRCAALEEGAFEDAVLRKAGANSLQYRKPIQNGVQASERWLRVQDWAADLAQRPIVTVVTLVFLLLGTPGVIYLYAVHQIEPSTEYLAIVVPPPAAVAKPDATPQFVPQVAGWLQVSPKSAGDAAGGFATVTVPTAVPLPAYPKEPRYEPDDASGDGELTPYQLLVEEGVACIYRAKLDDSYGSEHLEDAGPEKSDLFMYTYPASETHASLILGMVGAQATGCWKKLGGVQREPDLMKRVQQPYDIWVLTDATSGATAECGIWPVARTVRNAKGGIAAYCR